MFQEAFKKLELDETATILDQIQNDLDTVFDPLDTTILSWDTPFYPGYRVLDISNQTLAPPLRRYAVYSHNHWVILDYTNKPLYDLNAKLPVKLNRENVSDYIRFFFKFVKGKHGWFHIVESVDDINWKEDPPPQARKAIGEMINPVTLIPPPPGSDNTQFYALACMMFKNALVKTDVTVNAKGFVTLSNEQLQVDDMPVMDETLDS